MAFGERWLSSLRPFVASRLPAAPARVLELGCGPAGGFVPSLRASGYEAIGIDRNAPAGPDYRQSDFERYTPGEPVDAIIASRSLHHVGERRARCSGTSPRVCGPEARDRRRMGLGALRRGDRALVLRAARRARGRGVRVAAAARAADGASRARPGRRTSPRGRTGTASSTRSGILAGLDRHFERGRERARAVLLRRSRGRLRGGRAGRDRGRRDRRDRHPLHRHARAPAAQAAASASSASISSPASAVTPRSAYSKMRAPRSRLTATTVPTAGHADEVRERARDAEREVGARRDASRRRRRRARRASHGRPRPAVARRRGARRGARRDGAAAVDRTAGAGADGDDRVARRPSAGARRCSMRGRARVVLEGAARRSGSGARGQDGERRAASAAAGRSWRRRRARAGRAGRPRGRRRRSRAPGGGRRRSPRRAGAARRSRRCGRRRRARRRARGRARRRRRAASRARRRRRRARARSPSASVARRASRARCPSAPSPCASRRRTPCRRCAHQRVLERLGAERRDRRVAGHELDLAALAGEQLGERGADEIAVAVVDDDATRRRALVRRARPARASGRAPRPRGAGDRRAREAVEAVRAQCEPVASTIASAASRGDLGGASARRPLISSTFGEALERGHAIGGQAAPLGEPREAREQAEMPAHRRRRARRAARAPRRGGRA